MKCPECGYVSFDYLTECKKCGKPLKPKSRSYIYAPEMKEKPTWETQEPRVQEDMPTTEFKAWENLTTPGVPDLTEDLRREIAEEISPPVEEAELEAEEVEGFEEAFLNPAGFVKRLEAFIIDSIILAVLAVLTLASGIILTETAFIISSETLVSLLIPLYLLLLLFSSTYFIFLQGFSGKTIGKMVMGIKVVKDTGDSIGFWEALLRWFGYFISALFVFLGFIWAIFDSKNQTWHDKFVGTYVIKKD